MRSEYFRKKYHLNAKDHCASWRIEIPRSQFLSEKNNYSLWLEHVLVTVRQLGITSLIKLIKPFLISMMLFPAIHAAEFKDPTEPPDVDLHTTKSTSKDILHKLNVYEIVSNGQERWAVINNTIVREGDLILGERVIAIGKDQVKLKGDTGVIQLHLINGKPIKEISQ